MQIVVWVNQILAYCFTKSNQNEEFFTNAINMYIDIIGRLDKTEKESDFFMKIFLIQLSTAFDHAKLLVGNIERLICVISSYIPYDDNLKDKELATVYIQFCIGGARKFKEQNETDAVKLLLQTAFNLLSLRNLWKEEEIRPYKQKIQEFKEIKCYLLQFFDNCYKNYLESKSGLTPELMFFKSLIDDCEDDSIKRKAFSYVVRNEKTYHGLTNNVSVDKWQTNFIKELFYQLYPLDIFQKQGQVLNNDIFDLLYYGEAEKTNDLEEHAKNIIRNAIKNEPIVVLKSLNVIGSFLLSHIDFTISISHEFVQLGSIPNLEQLDIQWLLVIYNMLIQLDSLTEEDYALVTKYIDSFNISNNNIDTSIARCFVSLFDPKGLSHFTTIEFLMKNCSPADKPLAEFYLALITHLMSEDKYKHNFTLDKSLWNLFVDPQKQTLNVIIIAALLYIATSTNYFAENSEDACELLKIIETNIEISKSSGQNDVKRLEIIDFLNILRTAILCGNDYTPDFETPPNEEVEHYATSKYIVSIVGRNKLVIRHPLGATTFMIYDQGESEIESPQTMELPSDTEEVKSDEISTKSDDLDMNDPFTQKILNLNSMFQDNSEFIPYKPPPDPINASDVYSFLVDIGFLNYGSSEFVKRLNADDPSLKDLFQSKFQCEINCGVLQVNQDDNKSDVGYHCRSNKMILELLKDLSNNDNLENPKFTTPLVEIDYLAPFGAVSPKKNVGDSCTVILLNEDDSVIVNSYAEKFMFLIMVKPRGDFYELELVNKKYDYFTPFIPTKKEKYLPWFIKKSCLGKFVALLTIIQQFKNEAKKPAFMSLMMDRSDRIYSMFNKLNSSYGLSIFAKLRSSE
ncbi:hypothetical protein TVAG_054520 [Trichomonas vaginalis G3]|uniref:Uncharacterized protein n=1 Tax=Trichomonas vaginalis (strain ATCC PRA-98 / G3) TaxID=412133 RepID=A2EYC7_TRIV3|nr:hypothetical protein TVAGG3_0774220 [Trichomonas vaginalis G3]EAY02354.1 hypothetical protein TVAG_054520 [Trichomonas vaginalis G3]KAI5514042.1 hypothetical protein TVAGG3_0774220 [Trichomonas vaginalis G3]|eukprot:XP_001330621.1 hypothetical protein [Trichomonas vaginalis G3]